MITYNNQNYAVCLDETRGALLSLKKGTHEFVCRTAVLPLFALRLRNERGDTVFLDAFEATEHRTEREGNTHRLMFSGFEKTALQVTVTVTFAREITWHIAVENHSDLCLEWVDFPQIAVPNDLVGEGGDSKIFWGFNEGVVVSSLAERERSWNAYQPPEYPSRGTAGVYPGAVELPFLAYYNAGGGLYMAAHDSEGHVKGVDFHAEGEGIKLEFRLFTGTNPGEDFKPAYPLVMAFFTGDWYAAADLYRNWFESHRDPGFLPMRDNPHLPAWYGQSPVVVTYPVRGRHDTDEMTPNKLFPYVAALPQIERLAKELDSQIMVILMHWEGTAPWAPPYVWPPYGGEEALRAYIDALHEKGHLLGLYCSGLGWTYQSKLIEAYNGKKQFEEENLSEVMCLSPQGDLPFCQICPAQRIGYDLCPSQNFTVQTIAGEAAKMAASGVDYIQLLDQNHGGTPYFCYSRRHGHPAVPGKWQTDAMKRLLKAVEQHTQGAGRQILLGCESAAAEPFIPQLLFSDNRFELCFQFGHAVPAYAYVFHEYVNNFMGNQVCAGEFFDHARSPENLLFRMAYAFCAGDMLTLVINENGEVAWNWGEKVMTELPDQRSVLALVKNLNAWRRGVGKDFLHDGRMLAPLPMQQPAAQALMMADGRTLSCDRILTTRWQRRDGQSGQILVNYLPEEADVILRLPAKAPYAVYADAFGAPAAQGIAEADGVSLTVPALSALLVVTPA